MTLYVSKWFSLVLTLLIATGVFFGVYTNAFAHHCGGAAFGHPGGLDFQCPESDSGGVDDEDDSGGVDDESDTGQKTNQISGSGFKLIDPVNKSIADIFRAVLDIIMVFAVPIIVFFIIYAGFLYVTAGGSEDKVKKASKALLYAVIGGVIVLGANVLLEVITNTINFVAN